MAWRDDYQPGNFRGAGFVTQGHEYSGGRRVALHEFPGRDDPLTEDMGRAARSFSIECHVIGSEYRTARDALITALEAEGPGLLVHPWHGERMVVVLNFRQSESTDEGGMARFSIDFGEAGLAVPASQGIDAQSRALTTVDMVQADAPGQFANRFSLDSMPAYVEDAAATIVSGAASLTSLVAGVNGGAGPALRAFEAGLSYLPSNMSNLLRSPLRLGQAVVGLVTAVSALGGTSRKRIASFTAMAAYTVDAVIGSTPARLQQADNRTALLHLFAVSSSAELVRTAVTATYASYPEAVNTRDTISDQLDTLAIAASDSGEDVRAAQFDILRRDLVRAINDGGATLARVYAHNLIRTEPAIVISNRLYGHKLASDRADDLVARNAVRHPGFVPGGVELKVITNG